MSILNEIVEYKKAFVEDSKLKLPFEKLKEIVVDKLSQGLLTNRLDLSSNQGKNKLKLISEIKYRSPSRDIIRSNFDPVKLALEFQKNGAWAISVLTDEKYFGGSKEIFQSVRDTVNLPLLRKDFIVDLYQLWESKLMGADIVLLIVSCLGQDLQQFLKQALDLNLKVLIEVHTLEELNLSLEILKNNFEGRFDQIMLGVNNRNLSTFELTLDTSISLKKLIPAGIFTVSESGIFTTQDLELIQENSFDAVLIGEGLAKNPDLINFFKS
ncbi:MAG: indole-3-glycerol phosphate synthase TrpC [bacterium]